MIPDKDTQNQLVAQQAVAPVDTSTYTKLATDLKHMIDRIYAAARKGKSIRIGADEVHNFMMRVSALGEESIVLDKKEAAKLNKKEKNEVSGKETNTDTTSEQTSKST